MTSEPQEPTGQAARQSIADARAAIATLSSRLHDSGGHVVSAASAATPSVRDDSDVIAPSTRGRARDELDVRAPGSHVRALVVLAAVAVACAVAFVAMTSQSTQPFPKDAHPSTRVASNNPLPLPRGYATHAALGIHFALPHSWYGFELGTGRPRAEQRNASIGWASSGYIASRLRLEASKGARFFAVDPDTLASVSIATRPGRLDGAMIDAIQPEIGRIPGVSGINAQSTTIDGHDAVRVEYLFPTLDPRHRSVLKYGLVVYVAGTTNVDVITITTAPNARTTADAIARSIVFR